MESPKVKLNKAPTAMSAALYLVLVEKAHFRARLTAVKLIHPMFLLTAPPPPPPTTESRASTPNLCQPTSLLLHRNRPTASACEGYQQQLPYLCRVEYSNWRILCTMETPRAALTPEAQPFEAKVYFNPRTPNRGLGCRVQALHLVYIPGGWECDSSVMHNAEARLILLWRRPEYLHPAPKNLLLKRFYWTWICIRYNGGGGLKAPGVQLHITIASMQEQQCALMARIQQYRGPK
ncbi:uncharacterized protein LAJ45_06897 [Morchella importuna]|uniref:uncharacterized protein n=1 Tax=Morchella importuna TaxID=1174673 RepID=UPI001E8D2750|nr:uncharacterized protein LAJ45_06897 [Morchella importuna]KAH8148923.1 hypothetical protein LAJ45_06897 [Morchella importuna]